MQTAYVLRETGYKGQTTVINMNSCLCRHTFPPFFLTDDEYKVSARGVALLKEKRYKKARHKPPLGLHSIKSSLPFQLLLLSLQTLSAK